VTERRLRFRGGPWTLLGFGVALAVWVVASLLVRAAAADAPAWLELTAYVLPFLALAAITLLVLRVERVRPAELGASWGHLRAALLAGVVVWVGLNAVGVVAATVTGHRWGVDLLLATVGRRWASLPASTVLGLAVQFLVVGLIEEFAVRGYFQTKVVALVGDGSRLRVGVGIVTASLLFGALHTPGAVVAGASVGGVLGAALLPLLTGLLFGLFYELTHNVYFVAILHGIGNTWPIVIDWSTWATDAVAVLFVGVAVVYLGVALGYRRLAIGTDRTPSIGRIDTGAGLPSR
jgi:membrane protease YdiL (CAAX protease family)